MNRIKELERYCSIFLCNLSSQLTKLQVDSRQDAKNMETAVTDINKLCKDNNAAVSFEIGKENSNVEDRNSLLIEHNNAVRKLSETISSKEIELARCRQQIKSV